MRTQIILASLLLTLTALAGPSSAAAAPPEEVCIQTTPTYLTQYHCAGFDDVEEDVQARVISANWYYHPVYYPCVEVSGGPSWTIMIHPDNCLAPVKNLRPIQSYAATVDVKPIHASASVGDVPGICDVSYKLCTVLSVATVCPAWGCGPIVNPCTYTVDACVDTDGAWAEVDEVGLADVNDDGKYESFALRSGSNWTVIAAS